MFVDVAFPISNFKTFTYRVNKNLEDNIQIGIRVKAPFGKRVEQGIITGLRVQPDYFGEIKDIIGLVDDFQFMTDELWRLIQWMSKYYVTPLGKVGQAVLPRNLSTRYIPTKKFMVQSNSNPTNKVLEQLNKKAPKQYELFKIINQSDKPIRISILNKYIKDALHKCRELEKRNLVKVSQITSTPDVTGISFEPIHKKIIFNNQQKKVVDEIIYALDSKEYSPFLLHGVTGSGKTEIYIEAVRHCLKKDRTAIILLPEISLTPQISGRFRSVFGDKIALWHSKLTKAQRSWTWKEICRGRFKVVIGARSAIFSPLQKLGLIVIDEEQESSFRQDSPAPRYHTRDVAIMRANYAGATIVLSSATPSLESYYNYKKKKLKYLQISERYGNAQYPKIHLVDMLKNQQESGKWGQIFSGLLQDKIEDRLNKNEQIILLHNRRGYSPIVKCEDCGEPIMCQQCKVTLTFHQHNSQLICHFCGYNKPKILEGCNKCSSTNIKFLGSGTQRIEFILKEMFPSSQLGRLDMDTTKSSKNLTDTLKKFANGDIDILLGTQMIAKGLDFPNATLVGIVNTDLGLHLPDFRAGERIFQLIYQASGRAGRRDKPGEVVMQTYIPDNPVIKYASKLDIKNYYKLSLRERQELGYPPYSWLAKVEINGLNKANVEALSMKIFKKLKNKFRGLTILGPAPCYLEKIRNQYRFQIVFKSLKEYDLNGKKLHGFILDNFTDIYKKISFGKNRINIHIDPLSLI